jgi:hypothetical protein
VIRTPRLYLVTKKVPQEVKAASLTKLKKSEILYRDHVQEQDQNSFIFTKHLDVGKWTGLVTWRKILLLQRKIGFSLRN